MGMGFFNLYHWGRRKRQFRWDRKECDLRCVFSFRILVPSNLKTCLKTSMQMFRLVCRLDRNSCPGQVFGSMGVCHVLPFSWHDRQQLRTRSSPYWCCASRERKWAWSACCYIGSFWGSGGVVDRKRKGWIGCDGNAMRWDGGCHTNMWESREKVPSSREGRRKAGMGFVEDFSNMHARAMGWRISIVAGSCDDSPFQNSQHNQILHAWNWLAGDALFCQRVLGDHRNPWLL